MTCIGSVHPHLKVLRESLVKATLEVGSPSITPDDGGPNM